MTTLTDLRGFLAAEAADPKVTQTLLAIADACVAISGVVRAGSLGGNLASVTDQNVQGEDQKALDVISNDILSDALMACEPVAGLASEELEYIQPTGRSGGILVAFDPLDGSSNIDVNVSVGTIFSLLPAVDGRAAEEADFMQPGRKQLSAGYAVYGPQTMLVLTVTGKVVGFTLDAAGAWHLTHDALTVPPEAKEFAINMSNQRHWDDQVRAYIDGCVAGKDGPRGKDFNMRWVASMVADVHRILMRGGLFMYPWDKREPDRPGKLRLLYEGSPMSLLIERAGGASVTADGPILDVVPTKLHQRVPVVLGAANEVARVYPKA